MDENNPKYQYLYDRNNVEKNNKNYLTTLKLYLNDTNFKDKLTLLPELKSATTIKFEKIIEKYGDLEKNTDKTIHKSNSPYPVVIRYIIIDPEDRVIDVNNIDENFELNKKMVNPYKALLLEDSEKVKKQAIEQIISNTMSKEHIQKESSIIQSNKLAEKFVDDTKFNHVQFCKDSQSSSNFLINKFGNSLSPKIGNSSFTVRNMTKESREEFEKFMKHFKEVSDANTIITNDQKIDLFVYLKQNELKEKDRETPMKMTRNIISGNQNQAVSNKSNIKFRSSQVFKEKDLPNNLNSMSSISNQRSSVIKIPNLALASNTSNNRDNNGSKTLSINKEPFHMENTANLENINNTEFRVPMDKNRGSLILKSLGLANLISSEDTVESPHKKEVSSGARINSPNQEKKHLTTNIGYINPSETKTRKDFFKVYRIKHGMVDVFSKYMNELKTKYKIQEDQGIIRHWQIFYDELNNKICNFKKTLKNESEYSKNYIEKIKQLVSCKEISPEKITLRDCDISSDRFYYLVTQKSFDFRVLTVRN
jgi:hypothetical protein